MAAKESKLIKIIVECGACTKQVEPHSTYFEAESDGNSCPGCDGSYGQLTCLCGGANITKSLSFQCPNCSYYGTIYIDD